MGSVISCFHCQTIFTRNLYNKVLRCDFILNHLRLFNGRGFVVQNILACKMMV